MGNGNPFTYVHIHSHARTLTLTHVYVHTCTRKPRMYARRMLDCKLYSGWLRGTYSTQPSVCTVCASRSTPHAIISAQDSGTCEYIGMWLSRMLNWLSNADKQNGMCECQLQWYRRQTSCLLWCYLGYGTSLIIEVSGRYEFNNCNNEFSDIHSKGYTVTPSWYWTSL